MSSIEEILIKHVVNSIKNASEEKSKLTNEILKLDGMSSSKVRHLLNNICSLKNGKYLEIGLWQGSTFISANFNNSQNLTLSVGIDRWWHLEKIKEKFIENTSKYLSKNKFLLIDSDSFKINVLDYFDKKSINIFFYDGNHSLESQELAFTFYNEIFEDIFIAIIDDYSKDNAIKGTKIAFEKLNYNILFEQILTSEVLHDTQNWWNGVYIAVIQKASNRQNQEL